MLAGVSLRQFERRSLEYTGLAPRTLSRVARFERALKMKRATAAQWTAIAHDLDYHDQMHLIHDFRLLAGDTPGRIMKLIHSDHLISIP